jgi:hypothetical protein
VGLVVNGYVLARSNLEDLTFDPADADDPWIRQCLGVSGGGEMLENIEGPSRGELLPPFVFTDFAGYLPAKIGEV